MALSVMFLLWKVKKMKKFIGEFKEFISKGNVVDMAVGVVIGGAFKSIIDSLVKDIIMPCISAVTGKVNIASLCAVIKAPNADGTGGLIITYGSFIQQIVNFLIISFVIFCTIKFMTSFKNKFTTEKKEVVEEIKPTTEELLSDIKTLLEKNIK